MFALILVIFILGYVCIVSEKVIKIDKTAVALIMGVLCWVVYLLGANHILDLGLNAEWTKALASGEYKSKSDFIINHEILAHVGAIAEIIFFLIGAMTIVEIIDRHNGFMPITSRITTKNKRKLLWIITFLAFFMSAFLDDLTTSIVLISVLRRLVHKKEDRWYFVGIVILAANAGGAWSPIGDVTTILLWANNNVTSTGIMSRLFLPCLVCVSIPLILLSSSKKLKGEIETNCDLGLDTHDVVTTRTTRTIILCVGLLALLCVPVLKSMLGLPPYLGVLLGLGVLWSVAEIIHQRLGDELKDQLSILRILRRLEISTILFFIGILTAVAALESAGHLHLVSEFITNHVHDIYLVDLSIGLLSCVVDNVALVAACIGMYPVTSPEALRIAANPDFLRHFTLDGTFWQLLAYAAGTGGSILIIGSSAGVSCMGLEKISFGWYLKNISLIALLGYLGGMATYYLMQAF